MPLDPSIQEDKMIETLEDYIEYEEELGNDWQSNAS